MFCQGHPHCSTHVRDRDEAAAIHPSYCAVTRAIQVAAGSGTEWTPGFKLVARAWNLTLPSAPPAVVTESLVVSACPLAPGGGCRGRRCRRGALPRTVDSGQPWAPGPGICGVYQLPLLVAAEASVIQEHFADPSRVYIRSTFLKVQVVFLKRRGRVKTTPDLGG